MPQNIAPEKTQAEVPYSLLEYTALFKNPIIEAFATPAVLIAGVLKALEPAGFSLDGVEVKTNTQKLNEAVIVFRRTSPSYPSLSLNLGLGRVLVSAENLVWTEAEQLIGSISPALDAVRQLGQAQIKSQQVATGIHIQLKERPTKDVTARLLDPVALTLLDGDFKFGGIILQREKSMIVIDASLAYANALFVRIIREHAPECALQQLAQALRKDEEQLCAVLGLDGVL